MQISECFKAIKQAFVYLVYIVGIFTLWGLVVTFFCPSCINNMPEQKPIGYPIISLQALAVFLLMAPVEELCFRVFPLVWIRSYRRPLWIIVPVVIVSSLAFGFLHGNKYNVLFQGVLGILLAAVYLKAGGYEGKHGRAFVYSSAVHFLYNFVVCIILALLGVRVI